MKFLHIASKCGTFGGILLTALTVGLVQLPQIANAATVNMSRHNRDIFTEATFIGIGLLLCLFGLFEMDAYRARHPRKQHQEFEISSSESPSTQH